MLQDIEKLRAANEASLTAAINENRIHLSLPVEPKRVGFGNTAVPWVTYEVKTLVEALDIFKTFEPLPWVIAKASSFCVLDLWSEIERKYNNKRPDSYDISFSIADGAPFFTCQQGVGFGDTEMEFFAKNGEDTLKIGIRIDNCPIRVKLVRLDPNTGHRGQKHYRKEYPKVPGATCIQWGYGDDCVRGTYWFSDLGTFWAAMKEYVPAEGLPE